MPSSTSDETYFSPDNKNSIILSKHNRYTPAFQHKHVFFELAYVLCGSCTQKINQDEITLTEGQFCPLDPHVSGIHREKELLRKYTEQSAYDSFCKNSSKL